MRCCATRHPSIASKRWHCCPKSHTSGGSRASQSSLQQFLWISVQEWPLLRCISKTEAGWDESETGTMWRQKEGSQVTTASSPSLWAVSFNIYSHGGSLNPDSWKIFTPVSLCIRTAKRTIDRQPKKMAQEAWGWIETPETFKNCPVYPLKSAHILSDLVSLILRFLRPEIMPCYYSCTLPPSLELPHESSHVGVIYVLCLSSSCLANMDRLCAMRGYCGNKVQEAAED